MGNYACALFGHSGDAAEVERVCRPLLEAGEISPGADYGDPEPSVAAIRAAWERKRSFVLEWRHGLLTLYAREARLFHVDVRWGAFAQNGRMTNGLGRAEVRERSRRIARLFGGDRILYVGDSVGVNAACDGGDVAAEETWLREGLGPPTPWEAAPPSDEIVRSCWFREQL